MTYQEAEQPRRSWEVYGAYFAPESGANVERLRRMLEQSHTDFAIYRIEKRLLLHWDNMQADIHQIRFICSRIISYEETADVGFNEDVVRWFSASSGSLFDKVKQKREGKNESIMDHEIRLFEHLKTNFRSNREATILRLAAFLHDLLKFIVPPGDQTQDHAFLASVLVTQLGLTELGLTDADVSKLIWIIRFHHLPEHIESGLIPIEVAIELLPQFTENKPAEDISILVDFVAADVLAAQHPEFFLRNIKATLELMYEEMLISLSEHPLSEDARIKVVGETRQSVELLLSTVAHSLHETVVQGVKNVLEFWIDMMSTMILVDNNFPEEGS
jgi:hypothetical protein